MSQKWYVLSVFGKDQCGIVSRISQSLFDLDANMCETSMCRLGDYFTILAFIEVAGDEAKLTQSLQAICDDMQLHFHLDALGGHQHQHSEPNLILRFHGDDKRGLIAKISGALRQANINILDLQSDVTGSDKRPQFLLSIEAACDDVDSAIEQVKQQLARDNIDAHIEPIDTLLA